MFFGYVMFYCPQAPVLIFINSISRCLLQRADRSAVRIFKTRRRELFALIELVIYIYLERRNCFRCGLKGLNDNMKMNFLEDYPTDGWWRRVEDVAGCDGVSEGGSGNSSLSLQLIFITFQIEFSVSAITMPVNTRVNEKLICNRQFAADKQQPASANDLG